MVDVGTINVSKRSNKKYLIGLCIKDNSQISQIELRNNFAKTLDILKYFPE